MLSSTTTGFYSVTRTVLELLPIREKKIREADESPSVSCSLLLLLLLLSAVPLVRPQSLGQSLSKEESTSRTEMGVVVRERGEKRTLFHRVPLSRGCCRP